jgi:hypothetical protein
MSPDHEELKRLDAKIKQHDSRLAQLRNLPGYERSSNLLAEIESEVRQREQAISERVRLKQQLQLRDAVSEYDDKISQQERLIQRHREQLEAARNALQQAEADLVAMRIERQKRQGQLDEVNTPPAQPAHGVPTTPVSATGGAAALLMPHGERLPLDPNQSEWIIGREGADIDLNRFDQQGMVSRRHARITSSGGQWSITDLGSTNGTWVGNTQLQPHVAVTLAHGTMIWCGMLAVTFVLS